MQDKDPERTFDKEYWVKRPVGTFIMIVVHMVLMYAWAF